jgi:hypothetical protein
MKALGVMSWWYFLCVTATLNVLAWTALAVLVKRHRPVMSAQSYAGCRTQLTLSALYVFGCAFRSALPVFDVPRLCLFNWWISSVIVGRSVATLAELSFVAQWALMLRHSARAPGNVVANFVAVAFVPLIAVAEACSWYSVLTTSNVGHVVEEGIWGGSAALLVVSLMVMRVRCGGPQRRLFLGWSVAGAAYVAFMFLHDVPMYWSRWVADEARGRHYLSIAQGLSDIAHHRVVSYRWQDWNSEIAWMSLYFSVAVWISISLVYATAREATGAARTPRQPPDAVLLWRPLAASLSGKRHRHTVIQTITIV